MKLNNLTYTKAGAALLTIEMDRTTAETLMEQFQEQDIDVTVKKHSGKRSLDANAYAWVLIGKLANTCGISRETIYRQYIKDIGVCDTVCITNRAVDSLRNGWEAHGLGWVTDTMPSKIPGCTNVILFYGSSTYDRAQMAKLIDLIVQDCQEQGIPTETPNQIAERISKWGE